jgi:hypothetical protein
MIKTALNMLFGALVAAAVGTAVALTGTPPTPSNGFGMVDGAWLNGLAGGQNETYQSAISAAGTTQATATVVPAGIALVEVDTVPASSGIALPSAIAGTEIQIFNSTATTMKIYPSVANNPVTGVQDTINGGTSLTVTGASGGTVSALMCAKNGVWGAK